MNFWVENIGRVERANIEIQGITVMAGSNASGKSTVGKAIYLLADSLGDLEERTIFQKRKSFLIEIREVRRLLGIPAYEIEMRQNVEMDLSRLYRYDFLEFEKFKEALAAIVKKNLLEWKDENVEQIYSRYVELKKRKVSYYENFVLQNLLNNIFLEQASTIKGNPHGKIGCNHANEEQMIEIENNRVVDYNITSIQGEHIWPIYITTSDLVDTVGSEKKLYNANRVQSISYINDRLANRLMKEPDMDRMTAEQYHELEEQKKFFFEILNQIVDGDMKMENRQLVYFDNWCQQNLQFSNIASGMKIFIILKRLIENGSFLRKTLLIIDEPESNLHPEWQLKLAEFLVLFYKKLGVMVYVNSHSPYFVRALEYYANEYELLDKSRFFTMEVNPQTRMAVSKDVTEELGVIYDKLAEPFNKIM